MFYKLVSMLTKAAPTEPQDVYHAFNHTIEEGHLGYLNIDLNLKSWFSAKIKRRQRA